MATLINPMQDFGLANILTPGASLGALVYVNSGGSDANDGLAPGRPKLTIAGATGALSLCTDDGAVPDTIVCQGTPGDAAFPITIDRAGVNVVAAPGPLGSFYPLVSINAMAGDDDCFDVAARHVGIQGFSFLAGATSAGIRCSQTLVNYCAFKHNFFMIGQYGIHLDGWDGGSHDICFNLFSNNLTTGIAKYTNGPFTKIHQNVFDEVKGIAVEIANASPTAGMILDNTFSLPDDTDTVDGRAVTIRVSATRWIIAGNRANYNDTTMTQNPYRDLSTFHNHWMQNWQGNALTDPVTT